MAGAGWVVVVVTAAEVVAVAPFELDDDPDEHAATSAATQTSAIGPSREALREGCGRGVDMAGR